MNAFVAHWLVRRSSRVLLLLTLLVLSLAAATLSRPSLSASVYAAATTPAVSELNRPAANEWPHAVIRLWLLMPPLLAP
ncbi:MAG TPA: hypothetical protein VHN79_12980 [Lacunisphaera sp.]|nr:hypothetical protein [Lacunisphaera sp.]